MNFPRPQNWTNRLCRGRRGLLAAGVGATLFALVVAPQSGRAQQSPPPVSSETARAAQREIARRQALVNDAEAQLREGDLLFAEGMLREAVNQYRNAFFTLKQSPIAKPLREVALSKYERAGTDYAQQLVREGRFDEALKIVNELLGPTVGSTNDTVKRLQQRLEDDEFYNRALTPEHVARVGRVEELLQKGQGLIDLGDFDGASMQFAQVLAIDPTNTGARRALERVDNLVTDYADSAYDHTRAKMLREVTETWSNRPPRADFDSGVGAEFQAASRAADPAMALRTKLNTIVFPSITFSGTRIDDAVQFLMQRSQELDTVEQDPRKKGVSFILNLDAAELATARPVNLQLRSVPLVEILNYVTQQAGLVYRMDEYAVTIAPQGTQSDALLMRKFRVPPSFLSGGAMGGGGDGGDVTDPFAAPSGEETTSELAPRLSAGDFLENNGITFPPGSFAQFIPETSTLIVKNTASNLDLVETIVLGSRAAIPRQVLIEVRVIDSSESYLKEFGFDWLLGPFNISSGGVFGAGGTMGSTRMGTSPTFGPAGDFPVPAPSALPGVVPGTIPPVTSALRSGENAITSDGLSDIIANSVAGTAVGGSTTPNLAPGVFAVTGLLTDPQFEVVMRAVAQDKGIDVLAVPSVVVRSGERAEFKNVREFIYPTEYDPPELPNQVAGGTGPTGSFPVTPANPTAFETRELGNLLEVEPLIGSDDITVELNLVPEVSSFLGFINYGTPIISAGVVLTPNRIVMPVFKSLKETTSITVYDGQTVVMGGLMESASQDVEDKIPIMGDVPIFGRLFRSSVEKREMRAIVLFVKVRILDPSGMPVNEI